MKFANIRNAFGMNARNLEALMWDGQFALDGAVAPWRDAPIGSIYVYTTAGATASYQKVANNKATADWQAGTSVSGTQVLTNKTLTTPVLDAPRYMGVPTQTVSTGAPVTGKATAVDRGNGIYNQTVLTLTLTGANDIDLADGAAHGTGVKVFTFPEGRILVLGATIDASIANNDAFNAPANDTYHVAVGTGAQGDDATLATTDLDLIPDTTIATTGAAGSKDWHAALAASAQFDGTTTAVPVYVNACVADAATKGAVTLAVTGTLTLTWVNLGDY